MSSKERLCVECGKYIGRWLVRGRTGDGWKVPLHLRCYLRTGGPFIRLYEWISGPSTISRGR